MKTLARTQNIGAAKRAATTRATIPRSLQNPSTRPARVRDENLATGSVNRVPPSRAQRSAGAIGQFSSHEPAHTVEIPQRCHPAVESRDFLAVWSVLCFGYPYCNG